MDKKNYDFANKKTIFELTLCTDDEHVVAKIYKLLLKMNIEYEYIKM